MMAFKETKLEKLEDLNDDEVYSVSYLMAALKLHGLPSTIWWIRKSEMQGMIPRNQLGSYQRKYTGALIKKIVNDLKARVNE